MMAGKMMAGVVRRSPLPPLMLELEETVRVLRKEEEVVETDAGSVEKRATLLGSVLREEVETTSAGTAVR